MINEKIKKENTDLLLDLLKLNQERFINYTKVISILSKERDTDLISVFEKYAQQAQQFKSQLIPLIYHEGEGIESDPSEVQVDRIWIDVGDTLEHGARKTILSSFAKIEEESSMIYEITIQNLEDIEQSSHDMLLSQAELQRLVSENLKDLLRLEIEESDP